MGSSKRRYYNNVLLTISQGDACALSLMLPLNVHCGQATETSTCLGWRVGCVDDALYSKDKDCSIVISVHCRIACRIRSILAKSILRLKDFQRINLARSGQFVGEITAIIETVPLA